MEEGHVVLQGVPDSWFPVCGHVRQQDYALLVYLLLIPICSSLIQSHACVEATLKLVCYQ